MRQALNSETLFKKNKLLYSNFFANYPLIISSPGGVILSGAFSHQFGGIGIHQKIPLRNYIGIKINNTDEINLNNFGTYDVFSNRFHKYNLDQELKDKIDFLRQQLIDNGRKHVGIEIGLLNEIPRRNGLNNPGVNAVNFAVVFLLLSKIINQNSFLEFKKRINESQPELFDKIKKITRSFHSVWIGPNNSGFGALVCYPDTISPIVYQMGHSAVVCPLDKIFSYNTKREFPYDITIIGTSDRNDIDFSLQKYDQISDYFKINKKNIANIKASNFTLNQKIINRPSSFVLKKYREAIDANAINCLMSLANLLQSSSPENIESFFTSFNNAYNSLSLIGNNFKRKEKVANYIRYYFNKFLPDTPFAISTSIANNIVLFTLKEHFRDHVDGLLQKLEKELDFEITFPYISWIDGWEEKGTNIEQWENAKICSPKFPKNSLYVKHIEVLSDNVETKIVHTREKIINRYDILFDLDDNKIYLSGEKINSSDLPTTKRTLELIDKMISYDKLSVSNHNLTIISYFQDRNELQSKIISPLKALVKKKLGVILNLRIHGTLIDFNVSYFPSNLSIGLLKRK